MPESSWWRPGARFLRVSTYVIIFAAIVVPCVQIQVISSRLRKKGIAADEAYVLARTAYQADPSGANRSAMEEAAGVVVTCKRTKGAIARWSKAVRKFWAGENIYGGLHRVGDPLTGELLPGKTLRPDKPLAVGGSPEELRDRPLWLHPNMPFVVILLTPLAYLPVAIQVGVVSLLKLATLAGALLGAAAIVNHRRHRMGDWVIALAALMVLPLAISDIQHGNTNVFVLGAIVLHLWLYRRGRDAWAGVALALAICLKMTPALFAVYWLYQRNWRLLGWTVASLVGMAVVVPLVAMGPGSYQLMMGSWLENLVLPGLLRGAPYPEHINQSLWGVFSRVFMRGNIFYNPDDVAVAEEFGYINVLSLSPMVARVILTTLRVGILALMAWAIGWRKLPRDDARRGLHYGLIVTAMLILNQRTWDHHAVILLVAYAAAWYALAYGGFSRGCRIGCLAGVTVAALIGWVMGKSLFTALAGREAGKALAKVVEAWGPTFAHFVIMLLVTAVLLIALRRTGRRGEGVYTDKRIPLGRR